MNNDQFDKLTRTLANGISRRQALKMLGAGIAAGLLSFRTPEWVLAQEPPRCVVKTVKIWIKAFIPQEILGYTIPVRGGPYLGQTMIPGPPFSSKPLGCFLTDQRDQGNQGGFSSDIDAKSWLTSIGVIDVEQARITNGKRGIHYSDLTTELNCNSGNIICERAGSIRGKGFYGLTVIGDTITVKLEAAAKNPCIGGSSDIGYNGTITIRLLNSGQQVQVSFDGYIQPFPAFEMYVSVDDGAPHAVITPQSPEPDTTPWNLPRDPNRYVSGAVLLGSGCPECTTCNPNTGTCEPVVCDGPCQECKDGICQDNCGACEACNTITGTCIPLQCVNPDETCCRNECVDTSSNFQHCGACDHGCGRCMRCENGECVQACTACETCDFATNTCVSTCGACMRCENGECIQTCTACEECIDGNCRPKTCPACTTCNPQTGTCEPCTACQTCQNGTCVDICGECMHCENGLCVRTCTDEEVCCGDQCINPSEYKCCITSAGSFPCPPDWHCCASGECCPPNWQCCGGQCVPYNSEHCANCFPCNPGQVCCIGPQGQIYGCDDPASCPR